MTSYSSNRKNIISYIIVKMISPQFHNSHFQQENEKERYSTSTQTSISEEPEESPLKIIFQTQPPLQLRVGLFEKEKEVAGISQKLTQRAISWIMANFWSKDLSNQCLWSTILLFYSYKSRRTIKKADLELILLACMSLSVKMFCTKNISLKQLAKLADKQLFPCDIVQMEQKILEVIDYNVVIPHFLTIIQSNKSLSYELTKQIQMVCELMMVKGHYIFFNRQKLQDIISMLGGQEMQCEKKKHLIFQIKQLLALKQCQVVVKKYSSKFDVEILNKALLN